MLFVENFGNICNRLTLCKIRDYQRHHLNFNLKCVECSDSFLSASNKKALLNDVNDN